MKKTMYNILLFLIICILNLSCISTERKLNGVWQVSKIEHKSIDLTNKLQTNVITIFKRGEIYLPLVDYGNQDTAVGKWAYKSSLFKNELEVNIPGSWLGGKYKINITESSNRFYMTLTSDQTTISAWRGVYYSDL